MKKLLLLTMMLGLLVSGCATNKVWYKADDPTQDTKFVQEELQKCKDDPIVAHAYSTAKTMMNVAWGTVFIPFVNIVFTAIASSKTDIYENELIKCMRNKGYTYKKERGGVNWDYMSNKDVTEKKQ